MILELFGNKTLLQRASIIFAGPFFNIILTVYTSNTSICISWELQVYTLRKVIENSPAIVAGLKANDKI